jgi:hypothetical protein
MHGLQGPMDGLVTGCALIHAGFPLLPWAAVGAHEQGVQAVRDAVLVVVEATATVGGDVLGFVLAIPAVVNGYLFKRRRRARSPDCLRHSRSRSTSR